MEERYPKKVGIIFGKTEVTAAYISTGLDTVGDCEFAQGVMPLGSSWVLVSFGVNEPVYTYLGDIKLPLEEVLRRYIAYKISFPESKFSYADSSFYLIDVVRAPRPNFDRHGRPMYCHNYIAFTLGLETPQIFTVKHFRRLLDDSMEITDSGKGRNYKVIFKESQGALSA